MSNAKVWRVERLDTLSPSFNLFSHQIISYEIFNAGMILFTDFSRIMFVHTV